ncbi:MAG: serine/threonine protein kinase [Candidatus Wallbacteria bacterium]|nr:serine/threonine protein kinase [Candidatus Wallbacteria bacterium]
MPRVPGYQLLAPVASGAAGTVYRAEQVSLGRIVAIKLVSPGMFEAAETRERFLRETRIQASLSHPNLLPLYDAGFAGTQAFLVMELVEGGTLRELLSSGAGPMGFEEAVRLMSGIAAGIEAAHAAGIVHRDLKPENVLLTRDGQPKVADFGLARASEYEGKRLTAAGVLLGTPGYLAPEAIETGGAGKAADIYAIGVMLYEMLAGRRPFEGEDLAELIERQLQSEPPALGSFRPDLAAGLVSLVHACLERLPERRPSSAGAIVSALKALEKLPAAGAVRTVAARVRHVSQKPSTPTVARKPPPARRWRPDMRSGLVLFAATAVALVAVANRDAKQPAPEPGAPPVRAKPPVSAGLPSIARITRGAERVALELAGAMPAGAAVRWQARGGSPRQEVLADAGATRLPVVGLAPGTAYEGWLAQGNSTVPFRFETLPKLQSTAGVRLATGECENVIVRSLGRHVAVAWSEDEQRPTERVLVRESEDGGRTWGDVVEAGPAPATHPALAVTPRGTVVGYSLSGRWESQLRHRPRGRTSWSAPVSGALRSIVLPESTPGDELEWLAHDGPTDRWGCGRFRCGPSGIEGPGRPATLLPTGSDCLDFLLDAGGRRVVFSISGAENPRLSSTGSSALATGPWPAMQRVSPEGYWPSRSRTSASARGDTVVVVYDSGGAIYAQTSRDRGVSFGAPKAVLRRRSMLDVQKMPAVISAGDRFYLVLVHTTASAGALVAVLESVEGDEWRPIRQSAVPLLFPRGLGMAATAVEGRLFVVVVGNGHEGLAAYDFEL